MKNMYTLLQVCSVFGSFHKGDEDISYKYMKGWVACDQIGNDGEVKLRFTKEYKLSPDFAVKPGAKSENMLFDERGRLYAFT